MKRNSFNSACLFCVFIWKKFILFRAKFRQELNNIEQQYEHAESGVLNQICLLLSTRGIIDINVLTRRDKIIGSFKFVLLIMLADIFIAAIFESLYQVMICTFNFYLLIPSLFYSVVGLAGILAIFIPKRRFFINVEKNLKTVSRIILASIFIRIFAVNALMIQILYTLGSIITDPSIHSVLNMLIANFLPCVITISIVCLAKYSVCILGAVQKFKLSSVFN